MLYFRRKFSSSIILVVNISRIHRYVGQVEGQRKKQLAPVIIEGEEKWEVEGILNKRQVRGKDKIEKIYSKIWYLGGKRELGKCERNDWRIWKRVSVRYRRCKKARKRRENLLCIWDQMWDDGSWLRTDQAAFFTHTLYHKWSLTICDGCFDTLNSSKMRS